MKKAMIIIALWSAASVSVMAIDYPAWFIYPGRYDGLVIGFSYKDNPPVSDAEVMYCVYKHCEVEGYMETFSDKTYNYLRNIRYHYLYPESDLKWIEDKLIRQDRFVLSVASQDYADAFSLSGNITIDKTKTADENIPPPAWLNKTTWADEEYYYGVGVVTSIGNPSECWKNSEEQAIYSILTSICIKFYALRLVVQDSRAQTSELTEYSRTELKFHLSNIQTMERYPDLKEQVYYTVVRIPKNSVIPLLFDLER
jgi:hypothetical protein